MTIQTRNYAQGTRLTVQYPWGTHVAGRALCPDGRVRTIHHIAQTADTFFSVPATVKAYGKTVAGYITIQTVQGYSTATEDDPAIVKFIPYEYCKNGAVFADRPPIKVA